MPVGQPAGREVPIVWRGRRVRAFVPAPLAQRELGLEATTVARAATAGAELRHAAASLTGDFEALARLLLRAEGVASSFIEGVRAPVVDVVLAEQGMARPGGSPAACVAANLSALRAAAAEAPTTPLSVDRLCAWHRTVMAGSPAPERHVGVIRSEQGWIGGTDPTDAHLVTPPPEELGPLLDDLVRYANGVGPDPVAQAAVAHAQFEVIHPFADGNGRVGRVLVAWVLAKRLSLVTPPPVSVAIAADVGGYTSGLTMFRLGRLDTWVRWFADVVGDGGRAQRTLIDEVERLKLRWRARLAERAGRALRSDAAAWRVLDLLPRHLVLTSDVVASELGVTNKAANAALRQVADSAVLLEYGTVSKGRGQPAKLYVSRELLGLAGASPLR
jgi:Fic family protein